MPAYMSLQYGLDLAGLASADPKHVARWQKDDENPLRFLTPALESGFLPTRVAQIFFGARTYGWSGGSGGTFAWPPPGLQNCLDRIELLYPLFPRFELHIFLDFYVAHQIVDAGDDVDYVTKLEDTETEIEAMALAYAAFGISYDGRVTTAGAPLSDIQTIMDNFFSVA